MFFDPRRHTSIDCYRSFANLVNQVDGIGYCPKKKDGGISVFADAFVKYAPGLVSSNNIEN
ncbi:hypothetical protein DK37_13745 [Halomonas sp. SUBG004]|nr:hypothetical protein DK37_13745 [Halomonas sp. SUBG004]